MLHKVLITGLTLMLTACSTMQTVSINDLQRDLGAGDVRIGDRLEVTTYDNEKLTFDVTDIEADGLGGKFGFIAYDDIRRVAVRRPGTVDSDTAWWIGGLLGAVAIIALAASSDSVSVCTPSPCPQPNP